MPKYLDPKSDLVFKKIFGEHPNLLKSFLNAILPLPSGCLIESIEYLSNEQIPPTPELKHTVVDVRCTDQKGRMFIVEMQIKWTGSFNERMLFNAARAYSCQVKKGENYAILQPVYGVGIVDANFDDGPSWYHHYKTINVKDLEKSIEGIHIVLIELPKFKQSEDKHLHPWLSFMSELDDRTRVIPDTWFEVPEIKTALDLSKEAAYSAKELDFYDRYWDSISIERTLIENHFQEGKEEGLKEGINKGIQKGKREGLKEGIKKGLKEGEEKAKQTMAKNMLAMGIQKTQVASIIGISVEMLDHWLQ